MTNSESSYKMKVSHFVGGYFLQRKIDVVDDFNGRKIVFIHDIIFKKKQYVE